MIYGTLIRIDNGRLIMKANYNFDQTVLAFCRDNNLLYKNLEIMPFIEDKEFRIINGLCGGVECVCKLNLIVTLPESMETKLNEIEKMVGKEVKFHCNLVISEIETVKCVKCVLFGDMHEI